MTQRDLRDVVRSLVEPWMEVLFVGLSPDMLAAGFAPEKLVTVRQGGAVPEGAWDSVFLRWDDEAVSRTGRCLDRAYADLRHGGILALVAPHAESPADARGPEEALADKLGDLERIVTVDGYAIVSGRRLQPGSHDLVGLRRVLRSLADHPGRLASTLEHVSETDASERPPAAPWSIKELVGHLGDLDRFGYHPALQRMLASSGKAPPPFDAEALVSSQGHGQRLLAEMLTRYQHLRFQTLEILEDLTENDFLKVGPGLDGAPTTLSDLLRSWSRQEAEILERIEARL